MSYVYLKGTEWIDGEATEVFVTGHYGPKGNFIREGVWDEALYAMASVCYLNGGAHFEKNMEFGL